IAWSFEPSSISIHVVAFSEAGSTAENSTHMMPAVGRGWRPPGTSSVTFWAESATRRPDWLSPVSGFTVTSGAAANVAMVKTQETSSVKLFHSILREPLEVFLDRFAKVGGQLAADLLHDF